MYACHYEQSTSCKIIIINTHPRDLYFIAEFQYQALPGRLIISDRARNMR